LSVSAQDRVDVVREPARVSELEAVTAARDALERRREPVVVALEALGQLP